VTPASQPSSGEERRHAMTRNGFVLIVPLLVWNAVMWPQLPVDAGGTETVPPMLEVAEQGLRLAVQAMPLWLRLEYRGRRGAAGLLLYGLGLVVYALTWIPWLSGSEQVSLPLLLGPAVTPLMVFAGIAVLGRSAPYAIVAAGFTLIHAVHVAVQAGGT
jgi:hypothetical protein